MRKFQVAFIALMLCFLATVPRGHTFVANIKRPLDYAPGEIIVKLKSNLASKAASDKGAQLIAAAHLMAEQAAEREGLSAAVVEPLFEQAGNERLSGIASASGLDRTFLLRFDPGIDIDSVVARLEESGAVEYAEPNYKIRLGTVNPDDPRLADQWGILNWGFNVNGFPATPRADIKAPEAWEITTGSPDVIVAVTDTGIDITHPDLARNIYTNPNEVAGNNIDDDRNGYVDDVNGYNVADRNGDITDIVGHGTQMAGIIAAEMNNRAGITGVSQSKILPVRFFRKTGEFPEDFEATVADGARSLLYAVDAGAHIINASWSTLLPVNRVPQEHSQALKDAVEATNQAGALLVCIAGNEGFDNDFSFVYPGAYRLPNQLVVAASDYNDEIWHPPGDPWTIKSGFGQRTVDLAAPGVSVLTTAMHGDCVSCVDSEDPNDWYTRADGTSAAAAFVSGVAALVKSRYPDAGYAVVRRRIVESVEVRDKLWRYVITSGRLNALGALTIELKIAPPVITRIKYKSGSGKLFIYGEGIQRDAQAMVGDAMYRVKVKGGDLSRVIAKVPASAFPPNVPVQIKLVNPDGGVSLAVTLTR